LESGEQIAQPIIGFHTWGRLNARRDNVIWVCHALTASSDVASWWSTLFGPGKALDPQRHFIVCANVLGSCYGSAGPASPRGNGQTWGKDFLAVSVADIVSHQQLLFEHLGLRGVELVIGGSMGGFQALEWARREPNRVKQLALVASSWRQPADAVALAELQSSIVRLDPEFAVVAINSDRLYPPCEQAELARLLPHAQLLRIDSTRGHDGFLADTDSFAPALRDFLSLSVAATPLRIPTRSTDGRARPVALIGATGRVDGALLSLLAAQPQRYRL